MTPDEVFAAVATRCPFMSRDDWSDFLSLDPDLQAAKARLIKDAVLAQPDGPSVWTWLLSFLGAAGNVAGDVSGIAGAYSALKAIA